MGFAYDACKLGCLTFVFVIMRRGLVLVMAVIGCGEELGHDCIVLVVRHYYFCGWCGVCRFVCLDSLCFALVFGEYCVFGVLGFV